jgi:hypothetical protein
MPKVIDTKFLILLCAICFCCVFSACKKEKETHSSRNFHMGFTPWPYDATQQAVDWTYTTIFSEGDIISHHMEEGVPWQESYEHTEFPKEFMNEIQSRINKNYSNHSILLSLNPLNMERNSLALNRGSSEAMPLPEPWNTYSFSSNEVKVAYEQYVLRMITYFKPNYLILGVEVNLLLRNSPEQWNAYVELHSYVYQKIKLLYPDLQIGVSVFCVPYFPEWSPEDNLQAQLDGLEDITPHIDFLAYSVHPFMSALLAESFPRDYFERLFSYTTKPIAISESSYPAQEWQTIEEPILTWTGTEKKQEAFLSNMLTAAQEHKSLFVIWFSARDFDALWNGILNEDPIALIWRDTGLFDEEGTPRDAHSTWANWLKKTYVYNK